MAWFAPCYDLLLTSAEATWLGELRREAVSGLVGRVVEIGAGTGANLRWYDDAAEVHACEPDATMRARLVARAAQRPNTVVHDAAAESLPFPDGWADAAVSTLVMCSVDDVERAVSELVRVVRPGGELRLLEHGAADGWRDGLQRLLDPAWRRLAGGCRLTRRPWDVVARVVPAHSHATFPLGAPPFLHPIVSTRATLPGGPLPPGKDYGTRSTG